MFDIIYEIYNWIKSYYITTFDAFCIYKIILLKEVYNNKKKNWASFIVFKLIEIDVIEIFFWRHFLFYLFIYLIIIN